MRNQQSSDSITLDRYEAIRAQQLQMAPEGARLLQDESRPLLPSLTNRARGVPAPNAATPGQASPAATATPAATPLPVPSGR